MLSPISGPTERVRILKLHSCSLFVLTTCDALHMQVGKRPLPSSWEPLVTGVFEVGGPVQARWSFGW